MASNTIPRRFVYLNAKQMFMSYGIDATNAQLTQSEVRCEIPAVVNQNRFTVPILVNTSNGSAVGTYNTERRLPLQDALVVSEIAVMTANPSSNTDDTFRLLTWPNNAVYTTANAATSLYSLYNGYMVYNVNNQDIDPHWGLNRCLYIPRTQDNGASAVPYTFDSVNYDEFPYSAVEPNWVLSGAMNFKVTLGMANGLAAVQSAFSRIVVIFRGVYAQNVTSVK